MSKVRYVVVVLIALIVVVFLAGVMGRMAGESVNPTKPQKPHVSGEVVTAVTTQDAKGVTKESLDQAFLQNLENWMVKKTREKAKQWYSNQGYDPESFTSNMDVNSVYTEIEGAKLAILKLNSDNQVQIVWVAGLNSGAFVRVACIRRGSKDIPVFHGACGEQVKQTFGVAIE